MAVIFEVQLGQEVNGSFSIDSFSDILHEAMGNSGGFLPVVIWRVESSPKRPETSWDGDWDRIHHGLRCFESLLRTRSGLLKPSGRECAQFLSQGELFSDKTTCPSSSKTWNSKAKETRGFSGLHISSGRFQLRVTESGVVGSIAQRCNPATIDHLSFK